MKNKKIYKLFSIVFALLICFSCFGFTAFAEDLIHPDDYNSLPLPNVTGSENTPVRLPVSARSTDNLTFLYEYIDWLTSFNMTNGQKCVAVVVKSSGYVDFYFVPINSNVDFATITITENYNMIINFYNAHGSVSTGYQIARLYNYGNLYWYTPQESVSSYLITGNVSDIRSSAYLYKDGFRNDLFTQYIGSNILADYPNNNQSGTGVYFSFVDIFNRMKYFITNSFGTNVTVEATTLDIGSIVSAVMSAPMIVFGGLTGTPGDLSQSLNLFGIDVRATLISLLVIAIVIFIIKFLRGG